MIALSMISEGDHPHLKRAVKSVYNYVDHIFITTTKVNKPQWDDPKITWSYYKWDDDFAKARNFNLKGISGKYQYVLWIDSDDVVERAETIPEIVEVMDQSGLDAVFVDYNYTINKQGQAEIVHPRERIIRNGVYHWKAKLHETLIPNRRVNTVFIKDFAVNHYPTQQNKDDGLFRNLRILQKDYDEQRRLLVQGKIDEIDPRTEYYLGRVLYDTKSDIGFKKAYQLFQDYLEHSGWDEERAFAWNYLGNIDYHFKNYDQSLVCYLSAIKERPEFPTWHINLSRSYAALKDFGKAEHHIKIGVSMEQPKTSMILTPIQDQINALTVLFYVFFEKKDFKQTLIAANKLYDLQPTKENERRIESVERLRDWTDWMKSVTGMVKNLFVKNKLTQIETLLNSLPSEVANTVYTDHLRREYTRPKIWPNKSVAYYAAIDVHEWSPKDIKTGLGGSEEAVVYLAKEWVKKGYQVTVYTNVGANEGVYDGVEYLNFQRFNNKDKFDVLVSWRNPHFIRKNLLDARLILLDLHDVPEAGEYDDDLLNRLDKIMVKSDYHRSLLPQVPDDKFVVVSNGIDWSQVEKTKAKRQPHALYYGSSPDRGLEGLLDIWPQIRQAVPDATLHVTYGFELFDKLRGHVPHLRKWSHEMKQKLKQPGITFHGKVGKEELYQIAKSCSIWAYPTHFEEIDCITARYCQALGTTPVVFDYAALTTTVQRGVRLSVNPKDQRSLKPYLEAVIDALKNPKEYSDMVELAKSAAWENVASKWLETFELSYPQDIKLTVFTPTIRSGFWNIMADNLSKQTYKNFEWLIVDDYPEDRKHLAEKYAKKYDLEIRYIRGKLDRSKYNYSLIQADNQAIFGATGSLIVWLQDFILLPSIALERLANLHRRFPNALIGPVDEYRQIALKPTIDNKEDWFNGQISVVGKYLRKNIRIKLGELRFSNNPYDFEMNFGAIPTSVARKLNGLWEFQDDGLGFNNTEIAFRALKIGCPLIIDESLRAVCLDLWEYLTGHEENAKRREWNLNDARYEFIVRATNMGILPIVRDSNLDRKIKLDNEMPDGLDQEGAAKWIQKNSTKLAKKWMEEWK